MNKPKEIKSLYHGLVNKRKRSFSSHHLLVNTPKRLFSSHHGLVNRPKQTFWPIHQSEKQGELYQLSDRYRDNIQANKLIINI